MGATANVFRAGHRVRLDVSPSSFPHLARNHNTGEHPAYTSGDPYLAFAKQAGAVPPSATRDTHPVIREQFKACALAVQYGSPA